MKKLAAVFLLFAVSAAASSKGQRAAVDGGETRVASDVTVIRGEFVPGTQPDGNTIIFESRDGLVVMDSGRHAAHTQKIIDFAARQRKAIVALVNSHWHLDHVGGNPTLRREFPKLRVYASNAIEGAMSGFLADYRKYLAEAVRKNPDDAASKSELAIIDSGHALYPDEVITGAGTRSIGGHTFDVGFERDTVTAGDVWLFDKKSGVLAAGDLVTLPAPFLDTACPEHWSTALGKIAKVKFKLLVPGHGAPMDRVAFERYRRSFDALLTCAASDASKSRCTDDWLTNVGPLVPASDQMLARSLLDYYFETSLRGDAANHRKLCGEETKS